MRSRAHFPLHSRVAVASRLGRDLVGSSSRGELDHPERHCQRMSAHCIRPHRARVNRTQRGIKGTDAGSQERAILRFQRAECCSRTAPCCTGLLHLISTTSRCAEILHRSLLPCVYVLAFVAFLTKSVLPSLSRVC